MGEVVTSPICRGPISAGRAVMQKPLRNGILPGQAAGRDAERQF